MVRYLVMAGALAVVWGFNIAWTVDSLRRGVRSGLFMHLGLGLLLSIPVAELSLGARTPWPRSDSGPARLFGLALYVPSAVLVVATFIALKRRGRARDLTESSELVTTGVFALVRQPMTLGVALWAVAVVLVFQSLFSAGLAVATVVLMRLAARGEAEYNRRKFGQAYTEYARRVPMWNIFQSLFRRRLG
jgi:protein-S-isoprenylcysteine O-methyltransferase Ste14